MCEEHGLIVFVCRYERNYHGYKEVINNRGRVRFWIMFVALWILRNFQWFGSWYVRCHEVIHLGTSMFVSWIIKEQIKNINCFKNDREIFFRNYRSNTFLQISEKQVGKFTFTNMNISSLICSTNERRVCCSGVHVLFKQPISLIYSFFGKVLLIPIDKIFLKRNL